MLPSARWCFVFASVLSIGSAAPADAPARPCHVAQSRSSGQPGSYAPIGSYVPQCTDDGMFIPLQCHGSSGYCWCVSDDGVEVEGTRRGPSDGVVDCEDYSLHVTYGRYKRAILDLLIPRPHPPNLPRPPRRPYPPRPRPRPRGRWF